MTTWFYQKLLLDLPATHDSMGNGGAIAIGPDKNLYVTIGYASDVSKNQFPQTMTLNYRNSSVIDGFLRNLGLIYQLHQNPTVLGHFLQGSRHT
jgi:hypothetical protein